MDGMLRVLRRGMVSGLAIAALAIAVTALLPQVAGAASNANTALINGDSVTLDDGITNAAGEAVSLEQFAAENAGFKVTVVSGAEWDAMTAGQFAQYQVLIVGDPDCSETPASANSNAGTWAPVVMGTAGLGTTAGNRTLIGTDPEDHYAAGDGGARPTNPAEPATAGAEHLVQDGITFAGGVAGATGVYFDTSCENPGETDIATLDRLTTTGAGHWSGHGDGFSDPEPLPCGGSVQQIASNAAFNTGPTALTDANIQGWQCSDHVTFPTFPADWFPLAVATDTLSRPTCGADPETAAEVCGQAYVLVAGQGIVARAPNLTLEPETHSDPAGGTHTVIANVHKAGKAIVGAVVTFVVTGDNAGVAGTCTTSAGAPDPECKSDEKGEVQFTYSDVKGVGKDTIVASVTLETPVEEIEQRVRGSAVRLILTTESATATEEWTPLPTPAPPAPAAAVLAVRETAPPKGTAQIASIRGCIARSSYVASVHGSSIASVTFKLDGHTLKTLHKPTSGSTFAARLNLRAGSAHHVTIHVVFTSTSKTAAETLHQTVARCAVHRALPRFTG